MTATPRDERSVTLATPCERRHAAYAESAGRAGAGAVDCRTVAVPPEGAVGGAGAREHAAASRVTPVTATASTAPATAWPAGTRTGGNEAGRRRAAGPALCACPQGRRTGLSRGESHAAASAAASRPEASASTTTAAVAGGSRSARQPLSER